MKKVINMTPVQEYLTEEDFREALGDSKINKFVAMLGSNLYGFRVKLALYQDNKIEPKDLLYNDNIFSLPLAKRNDKKEILIDNSLLAIFDRYLLAEEMTQKGDALTAFMVDHNDELYQVIKQNSGEQKKITEQDYVQVFNSTYKITSDILLSHKINEVIDADPVLESLIFTNEVGENPN
jgi:hypothetical protein